MHKRFTLCTYLLPLPAVVGLPAASGLTQLATQFPNLHNLTAQQAQSILASMRSLSSAQHLQAVAHTQPTASP